MCISTRDFVFSRAASSLWLRASVSALMPLILMINIILKLIRILILFTTTPTPTPTSTPTPTPAPTPTHTPTPTSTSTPTPTPTPTTTSTTTTTTTSADPCRDGGLPSAREGCSEVIFFVLILLVSTLARLSLRSRSAVCMYVCM